MAMKNILDPSFKYTPSFDTDIATTFERFRQAQKEKAAQAAKPVARLLKIPQPLPRAA